jgi:hypothetical protein
MKLKKFNEMNESDRNDGNNILTENVKKATKHFLEDVQDITNDTVSMFEGNELSNISENQFTLKVKLLTEQDFTNYIIEEMENFGYEDGVSVSVHEKLDSRTTIILFEDGNNKFTVPLITTVSGNDMIYDKENIVEYGVWLNTYVAKKV